MSESLTLFPLDLRCLCIQCLIKDESHTLQLEGILDLERLHQVRTLSENGSHVSSGCVNSRQRRLNFASHVTNKKPTFQIVPV